MGLCDSHVKKKKPTTTTRSGGFPGVVSVKNIPTLICETRIEQGPQIPWVIPAAYISPPAPASASLDCIAQCCTPSTNSCRQNLYHSITCRNIFHILENSVSLTLLSLWTGLRAFGFEPSELTFWLWAEPVCKQERAHMCIAMCDGFFFSQVKKRHWIDGI